MKNRVLAMLLVLTMLLGMIPLAASAAETAPTIASSNLVLNSVLSLNITADLAGENVSNCAVHVTIGDDTNAQELTNPVPKAGQYVYTAKLLAHRLHEDVTIQLMKGNETLAEQTWTLTGYIAGLKALKPDDAALHTLLDALSNYGTYAGYYAHETADAQPIEAVTAVTAEQLNDHAFKITTANKELKAAAFLYLDEACDLGIKFDAAAMEGKTLYVDGTQRGTADAGNGQVVCNITDLLPQDWDEMHTVVVKEGETVVYEMSYSVLSYVRQNLRRAEEAKLHLNGLLASMYLYNQAANAYIPVEENVEYVKLADSFLTLTSTSTSVDGLPANAGIANIYTGGWTSTHVVEGIELEKYSELMFYTKTNSADKYFELYDANGEQLFATNSSEWVKVQLVLEGNVWTLYTDGTWRLSNLTGETLADLLPSVVLGGAANPGDAYVTDLLAVKNPNYVDPYALVIDNILPVAGEAADNIPEDYENSNKLNIGWTANGVAFAEQDLAPYKAIKFAIQSVAWHGVNLNGTTIAQHSGNAWVEYLFEKNGDSWSFTFNGEQKDPVTLSDLSDLIFQTGGDNTYYVTELRAMADPDYVPPAPPAYITLPGNPFTKEGEATTEESLEGFETVTKLSTSWQKYDFHSVDLAPYSQVEFAVKSSGYYGVMPDANTVIHETNNGGNWLIIKLVKNGTSWDVYYGDTLEQTVTLASNNISDLDFRFGDNTYYVTNLRVLADPNYVPEVYVTAADSIFDIAGTASAETIEGYETITAHTTTWNKYSFKSFDLTPYTKVKFAVKSDAYFGLMVNDTVINESTGTIEIALIKNGEVWELFYNGAKQQNVSLPTNNLTDLNFRFGGNTYHVSELKAVADPNYVAPKVGIIEMDPFTLYGTLTTDESIEGYSFVTALSTSWNKYNFVPVDLSNYTEIWFSVKSKGYYGVMNGGSVINETNGGGKWQEIKLVKNGGNWDIYYGGTLQQSVTLPNNNLSDLNFRFGDNTYYVTELMGLENPENPYVSAYTQIAANFLNNTPTATTAEGLTSRDVSVINITNCEWASPGVIEGINLADYTELKFWYKVSNTNKWFEMYDANGSAFYQGHATDWTEMKFQLESNGTWTLLVNGTGKKWGLTGDTLKDMIVTLTLGGSEPADVYVTDLIGIAVPKS